MTDTMIQNTPEFPAEPDPMEEYRKECAAITAFGRVGWALLALMLVWIGFTIAVEFAIIVFSKSLPWVRVFFQDYLLIFNELGLAFGVLAACLVLRKTPKSVPAPRSFPSGRFFALFSIAIAVSMVGNWISNVFLGVWNTATDNEVINEVIAIVMEADPLITIVSVVLVAPFLEEYFFRKLVVDRIRPFGELAAILTSASLFALFHTNFSQLFYTFGVGVLLAYLYLKSGNFLLTFFFHALFNVFSGVFPMLYVEDLLAFAEEIDALSGEAFAEALPSLLNQYGDSLLLAVLYAFVSGVLMIFGIVFFFTRFRKTKLEKGEIVLPAHRLRRLAVVNAGMVLVLIVLGYMMILSLFTV